jgi:nucleotide-binding universal stress UspA family protein
MSRVLACIDNSAAARPVLAVARVLAPVLNATVQAVHVREDGDRTARAAATSLGLPLRVLDGDPLEQLARLAAEDDVVGVVVGARGRPAGRRPAGHLALGIANRVATPVILVPPDAELPSELHRVLVALEGTPRNARRLKRTIELAEGAGLELVVVHVDDETSIPSFSDQVQHETEAYAHEFLARFAPGAPAARLELRIGEPAEEILTTADSSCPDLLAIGWPQSDDPARGIVAREVLDRSHRPVLLVALA